MKRFLLVLFVACAMLVALPTQARADGIVLRDVPPGGLELRPAGTLHSSC